jgi:Regulator of G protein signaling domain
VLFSDKRQLARRSISWKTLGIILVRKRYLMSSPRPIKAPRLLAASESPRDTHEFSFSEISFPDADEEQQRLEATYALPARPLTVAIPDNFAKTSSYHPRRPNLDEILANTSPPPWTLSAFMAYLSANHCLETLEFTMDAHRYRRHFDKVVTRNGGEIIPGSEDCVFMRGLWHKLMHAYILPNGPREVNLPSDVRHELISQDESILPPEPDCLNMAVDKVHELMEESVLVPFLNSAAAPHLHPGPESMPSSVEDLTAISASYDDRNNMFRNRPGRKNLRRRRSPTSGSPPLSTSTPNGAFSPSSPQSNRASGPSAISQFARSISHSARHGFGHSYSNSNSSPSPTRPLSSVTPLPPPVPAAPFLTTAPSINTLSPSSSTDLHTGETIYEEIAVAPISVAASKDTAVSAQTASTAIDPMTPPTTPPIGDIATSPVAGGQGVKAVNPWKRMRSSFGWKRKDHSQSPP